MPARLSKSWSAGLPFGCNLGLFAGVLSVESDNNVGFLALYKSLSCRSHSIHSMTTTSANKWGNISSHGVHGIWSTRSHWSQNGNGQVFFGALLNFQYPTWVWRGMSMKIDYCTEILRPLMVQKVLYCRSPPWLLTLQANEAISVVIQRMECDLPVIIDLKMDMSKGSLGVILNFAQISDITCGLSEEGWQNCTLMDSCPEIWMPLASFLRGIWVGRQRMKITRLLGYWFCCNLEVALILRLDEHFTCVNYQLGKDAQFGQHPSCFCISDELDQWNWTLNLGAVFSLQVEVI